jgi:hypothetical protein
MGFMGFLFGKEDERGDYRVKEEKSGASEE